MGNYVVQHQTRKILRLYSHNVTLLHLTLIHGYKKTYKFTGGGVPMDPKYKAVLFKI